MSNLKSEPSDSDTRADSRLNSMLIRQEGWKPLLLGGDLTFEAALLLQNTVPGTGDRKMLLASFDKVRRLAARLLGLVIVPLHDFGAQEALRRSTEAVAALKQDRIND